MSSRLLREVESQGGAWSEQVEGRERRDDALVLFIADELLLLDDRVRVLVVEDGLHRVLLVRLAGLSLARGLVLKRLRAGWGEGRVSRVARSREG